MNAAAPAWYDRGLAGDADERVRLLLARKIANEVSDLPAAEQARLGHQALAILATLVRDEATRIRAAILEVLAGFPSLPRDLVLRLAHDSAISVSEPLIRLSPLLTYIDLLMLLATPLHDATTQAIARRADLPENMSDAVAASADTDAIRALLANKSAAIRESTLDALIERALNQPAWHEPLVHRPVLPVTAALALSEIVTAHLLEELGAHIDFGPALATEIRLRLASRSAPRASPSADTALMDAARALAAAGALSEPALLRALRGGEVRKAASMLAVAAGVGLDVIDRAVRLRSAKGFVSLLWKAGFQMGVAGTVQAMIGQIGPAATLTAMSGGGFPLTPEEMRWQLDFLERTGR